MKETSEALRPRVLLVDDHEPILQATQRLLMPDCDVVGQISSGLLALEAVMRLHPDVVVLDLNMPDVNGLDVCCHLLRSVPSVRVVILTAMNDADVREEAFRRGASAFVCKLEMGEQLLQAVLTVFHCGAALDAPARVQGRVD